MLPPIVHDLLSIGNSLVLIGIFYKVSVMTYQHKLMWFDYAERKGIPANGEATHRARN